MVKKGQEIEVTVSRAKYPNMGIIDGYGKEIRIKGAIRGQKLKIRISRQKKEYFEAKIVEILENSPLEGEAACPHFGRCGGCSYQRMDYEDELAYKEEQVRELFKESGLDVNILGIEASPDTRDYRNKMEYTFGDEYKDGPLALGMHRKGRFYEIENVENCNIAGRDFRQILTASLDYFRGGELSFYNKRSHLGNLRNLIIRKSLSSGEIMVNLVTSSQREIDMEAFKDMILGLELEGEVSGILHTINDNVADAVKVDQLRLIYGRDYITEELCGLKFKISPFSFFQTNTRAAEKLYGLTQKLIGDIEEKTVFDLYSGTGTIAQIMAQVAKEVVAIELVEEAVDMARENASNNGLENIEFIAGDMFKVVDKISKQPDLIVIDPPRPGLGNAIGKIIDFNPKTFVYVSCNPKTLVGDLVEFDRRGYKIGDIQLVDQFPRTPHIEALVKIERK